MNEIATVKDVSTWRPAVMPPGWALQDWKLDISTDYVDYAFSWDLMARYIPTERHLTFEAVFRNKRGSEMRIVMWTTDRLGPEHVQRQWEEASSLMTMINDRRGMRMQVTFDRQGLPSVSQRMR